MRFATLPLGEAQGAILVHGVRAGGRLLKKGRVLSPTDVAALKDAGLSEITAVKLEPGDVPEDLAATAIARVLAGPGSRVGAAFTGRANLYAETSGLAVLDPAVIDAINLIDESVTVATLAPYARVQPGDMVATVKIIPFAAPKDAVDAAVAAASPISVAAFKALKVALVSTQLPGQKASLLDKNRSALEARLGEIGGSLVFETRVPHSAVHVADGLRASEAKGAELLFVFGASAITDRRDVIPAGIVAAGGAVTHFGMPVDPGNLLLLGELHGKPVVGLPSCARSPKVNGFDFVMQRLFAGLPVTPKDIMRMGVGGLLQEIPTRPQPRDAEHVPSALRAPRIAAIVLAAGLSTRMGSNKLLADWRGKPLIRSTVEAAVKSEARPVIVVTGYQNAKIESALEGLPVTFATNPEYAEGLSTSVKAGLRAVPTDCDGAIVVLGDMPRITPSLIDRMFAAFSPEDGRSVVVAVHEGKRGNPVLWARQFFAEIERIAGDTGAKTLVSRHEELVCEIEAGPQSLSDVDTPEALAELRAEELREPTP